MDPDSEVQFDCSPLFILYKSGRVERRPASISPAALDPTTGVTSKDVTINSHVSARLYLPKLEYTNEKLPILVYYHGGGFCIESAFSSLYQPFLNSISSQSNLLVVSVEYRLAPEHRLPAAYDDSWDAIEWAFGPNPPDPWLTNHGDFRHVFMAGDSAGANIVHQMALRASAAVPFRIEGMVLIHPYFWGSERIVGETTDPQTLGFLERLWIALNKPGNGKPNLDDPWLNPLVEGGEPGLVECNRVMVCVAGKDVLQERGRAYYKAFVNNGGKAELVVSDGADHAFIFSELGSEKGLELMEKLVGFFKVRD